ncbi:SnoaL-like domain-containing protein [Bradyrhizobium sp. 83012]|uniref:SnoaL-like domain-containing protein n=1 Tax=Bradyrhizobium aeschynomenes TaxID=2734909 RepID=A0ABX2C9F1_9BRAD|nr:ester cyclase [Bradyrhizobium aeschynomenes]NPU64896.1 SnoaL-like domain-containing protein [Bradyrhizobium aeschynomenes]
MTAAELANHYRAYIVCLNAQAWPALADFVHDDVVHNGRPLGLAGYRDMLIGNFADIPDLRFNIGLLLSDPPRVASRLNFDCTPKSEFLGLPVNGRRVAFSENVFYAFRDRRIAEVWSVIDKAAIETQLA